MQKLARIRKFMCYLPGIDCGACGAPTCQTLAEDVALKKANLSHCPFIQRTMEKRHKLDTEHSYRITAKVWENKDSKKTVKRKEQKMKVSDVVARLGLTILNSPVR
jgi:Na+-translocating ferredoxin:NAD+ oxidoreductase RNF subunit RnfB